mgnify:FL=1
MGRIKSHITINIFFIERIKSHLIFFLLKYNKNKGRKQNEVRNIREEKKMMRKKKEKKGSHPSVHFAYCAT